MKNALETASTSVAMPVLRPARVDDASALSAFMRATFLEANGHCSSRDNVEAFLDAHYFSERQRREIVDPAITTMLASTPAGEITGYVQLRWGPNAPDSVRAERGAVQLSRLYVDARQHGTGVGAALLQRAKDIARSAGADVLWLNAWQEAARALAFYVKHGFHIVGIADFAVGADRKPNWTMACNLVAHTTKRGQLSAGAIR